MRQIFGLVFLIALFGICGAVGRSAHADLVYPVMIGGGIALIAFKMIFGRKAAR